MNYTKEILELFQKKAEEMITNNQDFAEVKFGKREGVLYISKDKNKIIDPREIVANEKTFFVGVFKQQ